MLIMVPMMAITELWKIKKAGDVKNVIHGTDKGISVHEEKTVNGRVPSKQGIRGQEG